MNTDAVNIMKSGSQTLIRRARHIYQKALHPKQNTGTWQKYVIKSFWTDQPNLPPEELLKQVMAAGTAPDAEVLKRGHRVLVQRIHLFGYDLVMKRYDLKGFVEKFKYCLRHSRARRFWAAAETLTELGIPTPKPFGFLEMYQAGIPTVTYVFTAFTESTMAARLWIEPEFHKQDSALREACSDALLEGLLTLYRNAIYHRDTKTSNLLLKTPVTPEQVELLWIDLECVQCGKIPNKHDIIRNLVQLNGSLGNDFPEKDRCDFLRKLAKTYSWVMDDKVIRQIKNWTAWRLDKEKKVG